MGSMSFRTIFCSSLGKPPQGCPIIPLKKSMTESGVGQGGALGEDVVLGQAVLQHEDGQVTDHLGGGVTLIRLPRRMLAWR